MHHHRTSRVRVLQTFDQCGERRIRESDILQFGRRPSPGEAEHRVADAVGPAKALHEGLFVRHIRTLTGATFGHVPAISAYRFSPMLLPAHSSRSVRPRRRASRRWCSSPASCIGPPVPPPTGGPSDLIPCSQSDADHELVANAHLDPSCTYTGHFRITRGNVRFDCNGALITGTTGVGIEISTPVDVSMEGVRVQECRTDGFLNGIRATRVGFRSLAPGREYDHQLSDILIDGTQVSNSHGVGIYVDGYVRRVTIRNTT